MWRFTGVAITVLAALTASLTEAPRGDAAGATVARVGGVAAWYVGSTSAGTRIDFRLSPSGRSVRDFHFGSPPLTCPGGVPSGATMGDGNFPLRGLAVKRHALSGVVQAEGAFPANADSPGVRVSGTFVGPQRVTGTLQEVTRGDCGYQPLTFAAIRVRSLPARPTAGREYSGVTVRGTRVSFTVSRSGRRVSAFRFAAVKSYCLGLDTIFRLRMTHSYPAAGLPQDRDGVFAGTLSSRLTAGGRPAGIRVRVSVLFLSPREATGTVHVIGGATAVSFGNEGPCPAQETLPFRATLGA